MHLWEIILRLLNKQALYLTVYYYVGSNVWDNSYVLLIEIKQLKSIPLYSIIMLRTEHFGCSGLSIFLLYRKFRFWGNKKKHMFTEHMLDRPYKVYKKEDHDRSTRVKIYKTFFSKFIVKFFM